MPVTSTSGMLMKMDYEFQISLSYTVKCYPRQQEELTKKKGKKGSISRYTRKQITMSESRLGGGGACL